MTAPDNSADVLAPPFEREERYIVFKIAHLTEKQHADLNHFVKPFARGDQEVLTVECVVVEADWPEYEIVWRMIEARCTGNRRTESADDALLRDELAALLDEASTWHWNPGVFENVREPLFYDRDDLWQRIDFLRSALSPATPTTGDAGDGLRDKLANWRRNLAITRGDPVAGYFLHGPALDFVIEQLDGFLTPTPSQGDGK